MIRVCAEHGYFRGKACPVCDTAGQHVLDPARATSLSKFASGALRHFPTDVGLSLDDRGWVEYEALVGSVLEQYDWAEPEHVEAVIGTDPQGRFDRDG